MFTFLRLFLFPSLFLLLSGMKLQAQSPYSFLLAIPDARIVADRVLRGDGDTYGLGDWNCQFSASLHGDTLDIDGKIRFEEKANDFSVIVGAYHQRLKVGELEKCQHCKIVLDAPEGRVSGPNIGARGYRSYPGQGLIRRARIMSDTFGEDAGHIGGTLQFIPLRIVVHCYYAAAE